ncbi:receptor-type protein kinase, putative [Bodo saltans]|uniref:Receptor-type protein kinase, putative n=1 Tax=Bodo saltans TaxID=75058 RepID=A0A0S4IV80_BODSA|nr:receptor-type protein kinase, putative [Bodo saltans]|eukprot:CUF53340.1 receptor-type protein kinase, putative [Bodo saltans]
MLGQPPKHPRRRSTRHRSVFSLLDLNLSRSIGVTGTVGAKWIAVLAQLQRLNLADCSGITDESVPHFNTLKRLTHLNLHSCYDITALGFNELARAVPSLRDLDVSECGLMTLWEDDDDDDNVIRIHFEELRQLQRLTMYECDLIACDDFRSLGTLQCLTHLDMTKCYKFNDPSTLERIIEALGGDRSVLRHLNLSQCSAVADGSVLAISRLLRQLQQLNISYCDNVTDASLASLSTMESLKELCVVYCPLITNSGIAALAHSSKTSCASLSSSTSSELRRQQQLRYFRFACDKVTGGGFANVGELKHLVSLDISCSQIDDRGIGHLHGLHQLLNLNVRLCNKLTDIGIATIATTLCQLRELDVSACKSISCSRTDTGIIAISSSLHELQVLNLSECAHITDEGIASLTALYRLQHLALNRCEKITDAGLCGLFFSLPLLQHVELVQLCSITDKAFTSLAACCSQMRHVSASGCVNMTDVGLLSLSSLHQLDHIDVHRCYSITASAFVKLQEQRPNDACVCEVYSDVWRGRI